MVKTKYRQETRQVLELDPNFEEAHLNLAFAYLDQGKFDAFYAELDSVPGVTTACRTRLSRAMGEAL